MLRFASASAGWRGATGREDMYGSPSRGAGRWHGFCSPWLRNPCHLESWAPIGQPPGVHHAPPHQPKLGWAAGEVPARRPAAASVAARGSGPVTEAARQEVSGTELPRLGPTPMSSRPLTARRPARADAKRSIWPELSMSSRPLPARRPARADAKRSISPELSMSSRPLTARRPARADAKRSVWPVSQAEDLPGVTCCDPERMPPKRERTLY